MPKPPGPRYRMWIEPGTPIAPEIQSELEKISLEFALLEDVRGPIPSSVERDRYVVEGATRLRGPIVLALQAARITLPEEKLAVLCRGAAGEAFVIRRLLEAKFSGEMCQRDIKANPLYQIREAAVAFLVFVLTFTWVPSDRRTTMYRNGDFRCVLVAITNSFSFVGTL